MMAFSFSRALSLISLIAVFGVSEARAAMKGAVHLKCREMGYSENIDIVEPTPHVCGFVLLSKTLPFTKYFDCAVYGDSLQMPWSNSYVRVNACRLAIQREYERGFFRGADGVVNSNDAVFAGSKTEIFYQHINVSFLLPLWKYENITVNEYIGAQLRTSRIGLLATEAYESPSNVREERCRDGNNGPIGILKEFSDMKEEEQRYVISGALFCIGILSLITKIVYDRRKL